MPDRLDKAVERRHAAMFGAKRTWWLSRDWESDWLSGESKEREKLPQWLQSAMRQSVMNAGRRLPILVLHEKGRPYDEDLVVLRAGDFVDSFGLG